eukprot:TRINITY_DN839_c0_g1_i1.p1 TRINITY_DN839_c0_g1~~TRINITY_DN839_c0_g1_i1.p1  ORF type:complete len:840 (-),score=203.46 TRINITY_DN839_c0_g1_i1:37-2556(-)
MISTFVLPDGSIIEKNLNDFNSVSSLRIYFANILKMMVVIISPLGLLENNYQLRFLKLWSKPIEFKVSSPSNVDNVNRLGFASHIYVHKDTKYAIKHCYYEILSKLPATPTLILCGIGSSHQKHFDLISQIFVSIAPNVGYVVFGISDISSEVSSYEKDLIFSSDIVQMIAISDHLGKYYFDYVNDNNTTITEETSTQLSSIFSSALAGSCKYGMDVSSSDVLCCSDVENVVTDEEYVVSESEFRKSDDISSDNLGDIDIHIIPENHISDSSSGESNSVENNACNAHETEFTASFTYLPSQISERMFHDPSFEFQTNTLSDQESYSMFSVSSYSENPLEANIGPKLVLLFTTKGNEKRSIELAEERWPNTPIQGLSSTSLLLCNSVVFQCGIISVQLYPTADVISTFESVAFPTAVEAEVTKVSCNGCVIEELDNRPALEVYNEFLCEDFSEKTDSNYLSPLGLFLDETEDGIELFQTILPLKATKSGGIKLNLRVEVGSVLTLMSCTDKGIFDKLSSIGRYFERSTELYGLGVNLAANFAEVIKKEGKDILFERLTTDLKNKTAAFFFSQLQIGSLYASEESITAQLVGLKHSAENSYLTNHNLCFSTIAFVEPRINSDRHLTILITDIESSTYLWRRYPNEMQEALTLHNNLFRTLLKDPGFGGVELTTSGDSFLIAFGSPLKAVLFSILIQQELLLLDWPKKLLENDICKPCFDNDGKLIWNGLRVRAGIFYGSPKVHFDEYSNHHTLGGVDMKIASHIADVSNGGQILLSQEVCSLVREYDFKECEGVTILPAGKLKIHDLRLFNNLFEISPCNLSGRHFLNLRKRRGSVVVMKK